ncbi:MAG TPA: hypothetical protein EYM27_01520 [Dehalococcoidia bacterium]|nr:hypothetical protein [Dehalococcoidia bacterium]
MPRVGQREDSQRVRGLVSDYPVDQYLRHDDVTVRATPHLYLAITSDLIHRVDQGHDLLDQNVDVNGEVGAFGQHAIHVLSGRLIAVHNSGVGQPLGAV